MTRYWKTTLTVVVLHEDDDPAIYDSLSDLSRIAYNVNEGDCSGQITQVVTEEVSEERMAQLLEEQGSDPEFLIADYDGIRPHRGHSDNESCSKCGGGPGACLFDSDGNRKPVLNDNGEDNSDEAYEARTEARKTVAEIINE
jgi:hypothetical protein